MAKPPNPLHPQHDAPKVTPEVADDPRIHFHIGCDRSLAAKVSPKAVAAVIYANGIITETF